MLGLFTWIQMGSLVEFSFSHRAHKKSIKKILKSSPNQLQISILHLSSSEFKNVQWLDKKEFIWEDQMYDVIKLSNKNNEVVIACYQDAHEKEMIRKYAESNPENNPFNQSVWKNFPVLYFTKGWTPPSFLIAEIEEIPESIYLDLYSSKGRKAMLRPPEC